MNASIIIFMLQFFSIKSYTLTDVKKRLSEGKDDQFKIKGEGTQDGSAA